MIAELERRMGVRAFIFTGYRDGKGQLIKTWFVLFFSPPSITNIHLRATGMNLTQSTGRSSWLLTLIGKWDFWVVRRIFKQPVSWVFCLIWCIGLYLLTASAAEEMDENMDSDEEDEIPHLETDESGYPTLPPIGHMNLDKQKVVIRLFLQTIYRRSCIIHSYREVLTVVPR